MVRVNMPRCLIPASINMLHNPHTAVEAVRLATDLFQAGNYQQSGQLCTQILQSEPNNGDALHLLACIYWMHGRRQEGLQLMERAAAVKPRDADVLSNLGGFYRELGQNEAAIKQLKRALSIDRNCFLARHNLGAALAQSGNLPEALDSYERALKLRPDIPAIYVNVAGVLNALGKYDDALTALSKAVALDPANADAYANIGIIHHWTGDMDKALTAFTTSINLNPNNPVVYTYAADAFSRLNRHDDAAAAYRKAIALQPDNDRLYTSLAATLHMLSDGGTETKELLAHARKLNPASLRPVWIDCFTSLPVSLGDHEEIAASRIRYENLLDEIQSRLHEPDSKTCLDTAEVVGLMQPFYLAGHAQDNRALQSKYGTVVHEIMSAAYPQWSKPLPKKAIAPGRKLRVGFASRYFCNHANWKILLGGWIAQLDRQALEIFGYSIGGGLSDAVTAQARTLCDAFVENQSFDALCQKILNDDLDVLIYSETGMDPTTARMAALRLAPVQCVTWGHPETSGLPTIDYFLTSDLMEPENGQDYYTEKLVRLPNLSSFYCPSELAPNTQALTSYGISSTSILYLCVQSLHKYLPEYDCLLPRIAAKVPDAQFVFVAAPPGAERRLSARLKEAFAAAGLNYEKHVVFLPPLAHEEFRGLCSIGHIYLDSIGWSGCTTTLDALDFNVVPVTMPGQFMRGRHTSAMLEMMHLPDTIAGSIDEYVELSVRLGSDAGWRQALSDRIAEEKHRLYRDRSAIAGLENFLRKL